MYIRLPNQHIYTTFNEAIPLYLNHNPRYCPSFNALSQARCEYCLPLDDRVEVLGDQSLVVRLEVLDLWRFIGLGV